LKRFLTFTMLAAAVAVGFTLPALASHGGDAHPECADISGGSGSYDAVAATASVRVITAERTCGPVILFVFDDATMTGQPLVLRGTARGDTTTEFVIDVSGDNDGVVCVVAVTREDRAPNSGCMEVSEFPPGIEFN
jgi:hypothetical protein